MKETKDSPTEQKILDAAEYVFQERGYDGARMQEIADQANINKGLLHYYFKTKDVLFEAIFTIALKRMIHNITQILEMEIPLEEKLDLVVDMYMGLLLRNPALPKFVINELNKAPDKFIEKHIRGKAEQVFRNFEESVLKEIKSGRIGTCNPKHLFVNLISLVIFPFLAKPMIQVVVGINKDEYQLLISERKEVIKQFMRRALKP